MKSLSINGVFETRDQLVDCLERILNSVKAGQENIYEESLVVTINEITPDVANLKLGILKIFVQTDLKL